MIPISHITRRKVQSLPFCWNFCPKSVPSIFSKPWVMNDLGLEASVADTRIHFHGAERKSALLFCPNFG